MRQRVRIMMAVAAVAVPLSWASAAPPDGGAGAGGSAGAAASPSAGVGMGGQRMFDPATVTTIAGEITAVSTHQGRHGQQGVHAQLQTGDETLDVHLGPATYLSQQELRLAKGDQVEVTGSKIEVRGRPAIIAQKVRKGVTAVTLRDANGRPAWAGTMGGAGGGPATGPGSGPGAGAGPGTGAGSDTGASPGSEGTR